MMKMVEIQNEINIVKVSLTMFCSLIAFQGLAQQPANDVTAPLHLMKPNYETPYEVPTKETITKVLDRVYTYLNDVTPPAAIVDENGTVISDYKKIKKAKETSFQSGDFRLTSYEWGGLPTLGCYWLRKQPGIKSMPNTPTID